MEKSNKTIQVLAKIGKVVSTMIFVLCIVGGAGCILGAATLAIFDSTTLQIGDVTIHGLVEAQAGMSMAALYTSIGVGLVACVAEAVLAKMAANFFTFELETGTPFDLEVARKLKNLGICSIVIPVIAAVVIGIAYGILAVFTTVPENMDYGTVGSIGIGIAMLIISVLCKYGAQAVAEKTAE